MQSDRPTGRYERRSDAWLLRDGGGLSRDRFRDDRGGSALPWLLGIAANVLADTIRRNRIEASARQRMGLPLGLATEDGYVEVEDRMSPCAWRSSDNCAGSTPRLPRRSNEPGHSPSQPDLSPTRVEDAIRRDLAPTPPRRRRWALGVRLGAVVCSPRPSSRPSFS
jgi:DNA-directed RNA polymerase specialized sigma24 family protein